MPLAVDSTKVQKKNNHYTIASGPPKGRGTFCGAWSDTRIPGMCTMWRQLVWDTAGWIPENIQNS